MRKSMRKRKERLVATETHPACVAHACEQHAATVNRPLTAAEKRQRCGPAHTDLPLSRRRQQ